MLAPLHHTRVRVSLVLIQYNMLYIPLYYNQPNSYLQTYVWHHRALHKLKMIAKFEC